MTIINFLQNKKDARKIFGKKELMIIQKQLMGVNLTQSEKNRLSRDIRKKFWLIQEIAMFQDNFKLKKGAFIKDMIKGTIQVILEDKLSKDVKEIILFGSAVMKTLTLQSDIDIAVKFNKISLKEATLFRIRVQGKLNDKIDIQVFEYLPNRIKQEIKTYGKILYKI